MNQIAKSIIKQIAQNTGEMPHSTTFFSGYYMNIQK